jgi:hemolysin D
MTIQAKPNATPVLLKPVRFSRLDNAFLPAALEILETPLSPIRFTLVLSLCAFVSVMLVWAYVGRIDIIGIAQGKMQPIGRTKIIEPLETGKVLKVLVENGRRVHAGDVLLELDAGEARADEATLAAASQSSSAEATRRMLAIDLASVRNTGAVPQIAWPVGTPANVAQREQRVLVGDLTQLTRAVGSLESQRRQKFAERARLQGTIEAQQKLVDTLKERVDMRTTLLDNKSGSKAAVIDAEETYRYHGATLAAEQGQLGEVEAALDAVQADIEKTYASFIDDNDQKLAAVERDIEENQQKLGKARLKVGFMTLKSPIDGVVQGLTVTTVGQVVTTGEQIMQIVPEHAGIEIEAYLPNGDIGFVRPGQLAVVKVESFPFTTYGTLDAHVIRVGHDAIPMSEAESREENPTLAGRNTAFGGAQRMQNLVFPVTLALDRTTMTVDGTAVPLNPGMAVTVEIKTGTRRILEYLFSPLVQIATTAMKER